VNSEEVARAPFAGMYWTPGQQLAHLSSNGAGVRAGDLFASGTVSGAGPREAGSMIELTWNGRQPLRLRDGTERSFLEDGDTVVIDAVARLTDGGSVRLAPVSGTVLPPCR
jgi:fumarylacetoacetase